jgi:hypothetical protein
MKSLVLLPVLMAGLALPAAAGGTSPEPGQPGPGEGRDHPGARRRPGNRCGHGDHGNVQVQVRPVHRRLFRPRRRTRLRPLQDPGADQLGFASRFWFSARTCVRPSAHGLWLFSAGTSVPASAHALAILLIAKSCAAAGGGSDAVRLRDAFFPFFCCHPRT